MRGGAEGERVPPFRSLGIDNLPAPTHWRIPSPCDKSSGNNFDHCPRSEIQNEKQLVGELQSPLTKVLDFAPRETKFQSYLPPTGESGLELSTSDCR